jgi:hypothetical protein
MLQQLILKTSSDYADFFKKLATLKPEDQAVKQIINSLFNLENGCACKRKSRYKNCGNQIQFYLSNLETTYTDQLKALYQTENFKFEFLIS